MPSPASPSQLKSDRPIVFVRRRYAPFGGGELMLEKTLTALAARGSRVAVMASTWPMLHDGVEVIRCTVPPTPRPFRARAFARAACRTLSGLSPLLVQSNDRLPCCDIFRAGEGVHAAYLERRRQHEGRLARMALAASLFHREALRLERETFASPRIKAVIAISEMVAGDIAAHYDFPAERIHHIPNGVDLDRFDPGARALYRPALRARLGVPDDRQVALFVGSGFARKGLLYAMRALARLGGETELWVVGKDSRTRSFQATAERLGLGRRVRFVGPQDDVLPWYGAADIAVLPSIYEPFGTVALEAMACGLPIVVGEGCGSRELVRRFDPSLIREVADETDLAAGLDRALALARQPETAAAARAAAAHYGFDKQVDRMLELYEQVLRG